jgi:hypothetical protein
MIYIRGVVLDGGGACGLADERAAGPGAKMLHTASTDLQFCGAV